MINIENRKSQSLNGAWNVIIDPSGAGDWRRIWLEKKAQSKTDFYEYSFSGSPSLVVPGDFNTQLKELRYYEGNVWYNKRFNYRKDKMKRLFIHFGAVNYLARVFLNGKYLGFHEGGFTPFQFELTDSVLDGENSVVVCVNNQRVKDGLPGLGFDWFNYGGITRDVDLIETPKRYIRDYMIQLKKHSDHEVFGWVQLSDKAYQQRIHIKIPELKENFEFTSDSAGRAQIRFSADVKLWSPDHPKLYKVIVETDSDSLSEDIGFRNIEVRGSSVLLNGKNLFLKAVNIHEEKPYTGGRAFSDQDANILLSWAKDLGCNLVRLVHYPHNENMIQEAEKMGMMVWEEIPVYQNISFSAKGMPEKMSNAMNEMISRDKNRCAVIVWSLSNETESSPVRDKSLIDLSYQCHFIDSTRLITSVIDNQRYEANMFTISDTICKYFDLVSINEYLGWYVPWQGKPGEVKWQMPFDKPLFISEFGGEAKYGMADGPTDMASSWSEEYQEQVYKDQIAMFKEAPNLAGVCAWILIDYRSPGRMQPVFQQGFNRKGLLSEKGEKKKAWFILKNYYADKK